MPAVHASAPPCSFNAPRNPYQTTVIGKPHAYTIFTTMENPFTNYFLHFAASFMLYLALVNYLTFYVAGS